jgi:4-amino-4-deoxy-L-arabinose transferase-like glycosyltransferase
MNLAIPLKQTAAISEDQRRLSTPGPREWAALVLILLAGAFLRLWKIDQNGTGNPYYAAAVRSMLINLHNFFFVSFDPVGFVTVDKPPVALWIQTAFAKLFGYRGFTLILPQVLEGLGAIALVYHLVRRRFGGWAALLSALVVALSPVSVAVDRYNNTDACLVLVMLLAAWALSVAAETGNRRILYLALILAGVGFNTKMMAAFVALPAFYLVYFAGAPLTLMRRSWDLTLGTIILLVVALSWPLAVDLTPPEQRPFVGSTQDNSMIGLSLGWNGFQRLLSRGRGGQLRNQRNNNNAPATGTGTDLSHGQTFTGGNTASPSSPASLMDSVTSRTAPVSQGMNRRRGGGGGMNTGTPGPLRLADKNMAGQMTWFLPLALVGLWAEARRTRFKLPLAPPHQALAFWFVWFLTYAVVFSFMKGAMHAYYLVMLVPPIAAMAGIGMRALWLHFQEGHRFLLFLGLFLTALWQAFILAQYPEWKSLLVPILLLGIGLALAGLFVLPSLVHRKPHLNASLPVVLGLGLCSLFLCPLFWALSPVLGSGQSVEANPDLLSGGQRGGFFQGQGAPLNDSKLLAFLKAQRNGEEYLLVSQNSQLVAPIIIQTGEPVVAIGGFMGGDPILTANQFAQRVKDSQFRYMLLPSPPSNQGRGGANGRGLGGNAGGFGGGFGFGRMGGQQAEIAKWVRENGKTVDPALWKAALPPVQPVAQTITQGSGQAQGFQGGFGGRRSGMANLQLYDLRPDKETKVASKD